MTTTTTMIRVYGSGDGDGGDGDGGDGDGDDGGDRRGSIIVINNADESDNKGAVVTTAKLIFPTFY